MARQIYAKITHANNWTVQHYMQAHIQTLGASYHCTWCQCGWQWACTNNERKKCWRILMCPALCSWQAEGDSGEEGDTSCSALKSDIPQCESSQLSRSNWESHTINHTVEYMSEWCNMQSVQMVKFRIIIWHVRTIIDPFCSTNQWI